MQVDVGDAQLAEDLQLALEALGRPRGVAEPELEIAEGGVRPDLLQPRAERAGELEGLGGGRPALRLASAARLQPGQAGKAEHEIHALAGLARELDRLAI